MSPPAYRETDPQIVEEKLIEKIEEFPKFSHGQLSDWIFRLKLLPKESRRRIWIVLSRRLPYPILKSIRETYRRMLSPDRREWK